MNNKLRFPLLIIGVLIVVFLFRRIGWAVFASTIGQLELKYVLFAVVPWLGVLFLGAYRLKFFLATSIKLTEVFRIYLWGLFFNQSSFVQGIGQGVKAGMLKKSDIPISRSLASISSEIIYDLFLGGIVGVIFIFLNKKLFFVQFQNNRGFYNLVILFALIIMVIVGIIILQRGRMKLYLNHLKNCFNIRLFPIGLVLSMAIWVLSGVTIWYLFQAMDVNISIWLVTAGLMIGFVLGSFSLIPGGLGIRDSVMAYVYSLSNVAFEKAITVSLLSRVFGIVVVMIIILVVVIIKKRKEYSSMIKKTEHEEYPGRSKYFPYDDFEKYFKGKVLEIGCADGNNTVFLKDKYNLKDLYCVDIDPRRLANAQKKVDAQFFHADARDLPFPDHMFDFVYCSELIEHLPNKDDHQKVINEIRRVLLPGGHCIITTPNKWLYRIFCFLTVTPRDSTHTSEITSREFNRLMKKNFTDYHIIGIFGIFWPLMKIKTVRRLHTMLMRYPGICKAQIAICKNE